MSGVTSIEAHEILTLRAKLERAKLQRDILLWIVIVELVALCGLVASMVGI